MLNKIDPRSTRSWPLLEEQARRMQDKTLRDLFAADPSRMEQLGISFGELYCDLSRNQVNTEILNLLMDLARECRLKEAIVSMFSGDPINETEKRSVLHTALRDFSGSPVYCNGEDVMPGVRKTLRRMKKFCQAVHSGAHSGYTGKRIRYIVNIGIGGSDLGPRMVTEALKPYQLDEIETFYVSNVDGHEIEAVLKKIRPERTLFLIASKTFTTQETMTNAMTARSWFLEKAKNNKHIATHFVAISVNRKEAIKFGIDEKNIFGFEDWVGGRFSLWSPVGLSIALSVGYKRFEELLKGAHAVDIHFRETEFSSNIPVLMALISTWYNNFLGYHTEAVIPYDQRLRHLPSYLQQASMESNGKGTDRSGQALEYASAPITWGQTGTNGQHAFFQLLHQGTQVVPCDFIGFIEPHHRLDQHHRILLSNLFAQAAALMHGKTEEEVEKELGKKGLTNAEIASLLPFKIFTGNRPSSIFLFKKLTPYNLGSLIALYEHKIFVQGILWNVYSFDQWGVELGKELTGKILPQMKGEITSTDPATRKLLKVFSKK